MTKLFVGGLPFSTNDDGLRDLFTPFGEVLSAQVVSDRFSGRSKGFGFVEMANDDDAQKAIESLNGSDLGGRKIGVSVARPKEDRPRSDYNHDRGNYNRDNGNNYQSPSEPQAEEAPVETAAPEPADETPTGDANAEEPAEESAETDTANQSEDQTQGEEAA